ncbi:hypothetical protein ABT126_13880 [Streptomyces sp. NPDC002012]|uniref:hypothetical protein n=1 Tax=Streptomyces sp. NPDC002012 TaxID=3154532 RepID=UPI00332B90DB
MASGEQPEDTAATIRPDGRLHTGDIVRVDGEVYVRSPTARRRSSSARWAIAGGSAG